MPFTTLRQAKKSHVITVSGTSVSLYHRVKKDSDDSDYPAISGCDWNGNSDNSRRLLPENCQSAAKNAESMADNRVFDIRDHRAGLGMDDAAFKAGDAWRCIFNFDDFVDGPTWLSDVQRNIEQNGDHRDLVCNFFGGAAGAIHRIVK